MTPTRLAQLADLSKQSEEFETISKSEAWLSPEAEKGRQRILEEEWIEQEASLIIKVEEPSSDQDRSTLDKLAEDIDF